MNRRSFLKAAPVTPMALRRKAANPDVIEIDGHSQYWGPDNPSWIDAESVSLGQRMLIRNGFTGTEFWVCLEAFDGVNQWHETDVPWAGWQL